MMSPPPSAGPSTTDFAALLDGVALRSIRGQLIDHLASFQHVEFGHARMLDQAEVAMVLTVIDTFLRGRSLTKLAVPEIEALCERLSECAGRENVSSPEQQRRNRNACFDAIACIKALEARVLGVVDRREFNQDVTRSPSPPSNDR